MRALTLTSAVLLLAACDATSDAPTIEPGQLELSIAGAAATVHDFGAKHGPYNRENLGEGLFLHLSTSGSDPFPEPGETDGVSSLDMEPGDHVLNVYVQSSGSLSEGTYALTPIAFDDPEFAFEPDKRYAIGVRVLETQSASDQINGYDVEALAATGGTLTVERSTSQGEAVGSFEVTVQPGTPGEVFTPTAEPFSLSGRFRSLYVPDLDPEYDPEG